MASDSDLSRHREPHIEAFSDSLTVVERLTPIAGGAMLGEVHAFCYLACLLSIFEQQSPTSWGYEFTALPPTLPYAPEITEAVQKLEEIGLLSRKGNVYLITEDGRQELLLWSGLKQLEARRRYLDGATGASLVVGVPSVGNDLAYEPQLQRASKLKQPRELLAEATLSPLFEQFTALRQAVGSRVQDLLTPAAVYLSFLSTEAESDDSPNSQF